MELRKSILKLFSGNVALALIEFSAIAGFTQAIGTAAIGSFFLFQTIIGLLGIPIDLGISKTVEKQLSENEPFGEVLSTAVLLKMLLLLPWAVGLVAFSSRVAQYVGIDGIASLVVVGLVVRQGRGLSLRVLAGEMQVEKNALLKVVGRLVWVCVGFGLIYLGWGGLAIVVSYILGHVVTMLGALLHLNLTVSWPRLERAKALLNFSRYIFIGNVGGFVYQWMDVAILRLFVPVSLVGIYEIAWRVASVSMMLTEAIRTSLFPQISQWYSEDRIDEIESAFRTWLQIPLYVTIPAFAGAAVLGVDILGTLFGTETTAAYPILLVFMLEKILRSVQLIVGPSLYAMDKPQLGYRGSTVAIVANLLLNITLIPQFGLIGAAVATTVSAATAAAVSIAYVSRFVQIRVPWKRVGWSVLSAALMSSCVYLLTQVVRVGAIRVGFGVGFGVVVYFALLFANSSIRIEIRDFVHDFRGS